MKRKSGVLVVSLFAVSLVAALQPSRAQENGPAPDQSGNFPSDQNSDTGASSATSTAWVGCDTISGHLDGQLLCPAPTGDIDLVASSVLKAVLRAGVSDLPALCEIDATLVRTQSQCRPPQSVLDRGNLAQLMQLVARNWMKRGTLERADELYWRAYDLVKGSGSEVPTAFPAEIAVLQEWALLKLERGDDQKAKELTIRQTEIARTGTQTPEFGHGSNTAFLRQSLLFQARVFQYLGLAEARASKEEADALSKNP